MNNNNNGLKAVGGVVGILLVIASMYAITSAIVAPTNQRIDFIEREMGFMRDVILSNINLHSGSAVGAAGLDERIRALERAVYESD